MFLGLCRRGPRCPLRTGVDDPVCRTGGRQDGLCLRRLRRVPIRSGLHKVLFMGAEGETRVACQVSPFTVFSNMCVLHEERSKMGLHLSFLSGAGEALHWERGLLLLLTANPVRTRPGLIPSYTRISSVTCPACWTQVPTRLFGQEPTQGPLSHRVPPCTRHTGVPQKTCPPGTSKCELVGNRVFVEVIRSVKRRSCGSRVGPNPEWCP